MVKRELVQTVREAYQSIAEALERIPDGRLGEPVMDGWTGKDVLAHMAWWHDHSVFVIDGLRAGREPYDQNDPANFTDEVNERTRHEHADDSPELTRKAFSESFARLSAALEVLTEEELFAADRWSWLGGEALAEMVLWDSSRHYEAHRAHLVTLVTA